jgi:hypothetical protein
MKKKLLYLSFLFLLLFPQHLKAAEENYVTLVFPVRDPQYWRVGSDPENFTNLTNLVKKSSLSSTWLLHYDVIGSSMSSKLREIPGSEIGIFLEVTRKLADDSFVRYDWEHNSWSSAYRVFLSGYDLDDRKRLIDQAFSTYKKEFGFYPVSYGAWYIDIFSMSYIKEKYGVKVVLGLADQYSTDGYQTWGQYLNFPYIVSKTSAIEPARDGNDSTGILKLQWAPREPTLGLGNNVNSSNFSAQVNDYHRHKGLDIKYFQNLLEDITTKSQGPISQAVIGIEVGELEQKYFSQLEKQLQLIQKEAKSGHIFVKTMSEFGKSYLSKYQVSPPGIMGSLADGASNWWYFDNNYRAGVSISTAGASLVDLRFYHQSSYNDNDQTQKDIRQNLVRLVPAVIDQTVLGRSLQLSSDSARVVKTPQSLAVEWSSGEIIATSSGLIFPANMSEKLAQYGLAPVSEGGKLIVKPPDPQPVNTKNCHDKNGGYSGKLSCVKKILTGVYSLLPDFVYSNLEGQIYLGIRTGFEKIVGLRLPKIKVSTFNFIFTTLENFISLKQKFAPKFTWEGRQELDLNSYKEKGSVFPKGFAYGQNELLQTPVGEKVFENSFYVIIKEN